MREPKNDLELKLHLSTGRALADDYRGALLYMSEAVYMLLDKVYRLEGREVHRALHTDEVPKEVKRKKRNRVSAPVPGVPQAEPVLERAEAEGSVFHLPPGVRAAVNQETL